MLSAFIVGAIGWILVGVIIGVMIGNAQNSIKRHDYRERRRNEVGKDGGGAPGSSGEEPGRAPTDEET